MAGILRVDQANVDIIGAKTSGGKVYIPGHIVQIQQATKTDVFSSSSTSFIDLTGLSVNITPTSTTSKIFIMYSVNTSIVAGAYGCIIKTVRNGTDVGVGVPTGSSVAASTIAYSDTTTYAGYPVYNQTMSYLDSPASIETLTYKLQIRGWVSSAGGFYVNYSNQDSGTVNFGRGISTITVMEVAQ